jgi:hypothetical protein
MPASAMDQAEQGGMRCATTSLSAGWRIARFVLNEVRCSVLHPGDRNKDLKFLKRCTSGMSFINRM